MNKTQFLQILTTFANKFADKIESLFVKKETGKGLSTNDFTDELKSKLDSMDDTISKVIVDSELSETSTNAVQNKVITEALNSKAAATHGHTFSEIDSTPTTLAGYGITDAENKGAAATAKTEANAYTDEKIAELINGAPTTLDTLKEIADAMEANNTVVEALDSAVGSKAAASDLTAHTGDTDIHITADERINWADANTKKHAHSNSAVLDATTAAFTTEEKTKLSKLEVMEEVTDDDIDAIIAGTFTE